MATNPPSAKKQKKTSPAPSTSAPQAPETITVTPDGTHQVPIAIAKAIIAIQKDLKPLTKSAENSEYGSSFVPLSEVYPKALELLNKHNLATMQWPVSKEDKSYLVTVLFNDGGDSITGSIELYTTRKDLQAVGSAITYARRYGIMSILGMVGEDDDDGNKAAGRQTKPTPDQIAEIKQLCIDLKYPLDQVQKRIDTLRTADQATVALNNLRDRITQRAKVLNGEVESVPVFTGSRDEPSQAAATPETQVENLKRRLLELGLPDEIRRTFVLKISGKPFMEKCTPAELQQIDDQITELEARKRDGITVPEPTA
ncbi:ERF family protein [Mycobacteroides abscessus]|uniref:ERF family protein n=1 Tax=Mycobacteroides abscessus TaxID=36809 RepID=UPI000C26A732|nr:ERF family protein [Mycobacteroides abscessus]